MAHHVRRLIPAAVLAILVLAAACSGSSDDDGGDAVTGQLSLSLTLASGSVAVGAPIPLTVTLKNESAGAITVARPAFVPTMVFLEVTPDGGDALPFDGPWPRLRPLETDAFVALAAGESVDHQLDLAEFYTLAAGTYSVVAYYSNAQDGSHLGLNALVIEPADEIAADAVTLEVQ